MAFQVFDITYMHWQNYFKTICSREICLSALLVLFLVLVLVVVLFFLLLLAHATGSSANISQTLNWPIFSVSDGEINILSRI